MAKYMIVDGLRAEFTDEKNILQAVSYTHLRAHET